MPWDYVVVVESELGQVFGKVTGRLTCFIPLRYAVLSDDSALAPDQITEVQLAASQLPPKVNDCPILIVTHWQTAIAGFVGSISHSTSTQLAQGTPDGQVRTPKLGLTFIVENADRTLFPFCARSVHDLSPAE